MNDKNRSFRDCETRSAEFGLVIIINEGGLVRACGRQMKLCANDGWILWQLFEDTYYGFTFLKTAILSIADFLCFEQPT